MAFTVEQFAQSGDDTGTTTVVTFASNIQAGETVVVMGGYNAAAATEGGSCVDENAVSIPRIASLDSPYTTIVHDIYVLHNHPGSADALTITWPLNSSYAAACAWRISADGTIETVDFSTNPQQNTTAGTDAVSSGVVDVEDGGLLLGLCFNNITAGRLAAGTGFDATDPEGGATGSYALAESKATSAGSEAALWTITTGNTDEHTASAVSLREVVGGSTGLGAKRIHMLGVG